MVRKPLKTLFYQKNYFHYMSDVYDSDYTINGKKFAVCMVIDVSGSMSPYVDELSEKFNEFISNAKEDNDVKNTMDLAVLTFSSDVNDELNGFSDIKGVQRMNFSAYGTTNMSLALERANEMVRERTHVYRRMGIEAYKPWIILMTDGYPDDAYAVSAIGSILKQREKDGKVHVFALGMGRDFDKNVLMSVADKCFAITDWNFAEFFTWLGKSVAMVSKSVPGASGAIADTGNECQDMMGKFFGTL